jgi:hypothetical protein
VPRTILVNMGLQLATAMSKLMRPSETAEMVLFGFLCLLLLYAARVVYLAPKTMPPKWKRYEEEKRQRKLYEDYERRQREGLARRRAPTQTPGSQTSAPSQYISTAPPPARSCGNRLPGARSFASSRMSLLSSVAQNSRLSWQPRGCQAVLKDREINAVGEVR